MKDIGRNNDTKCTLFEGTVEDKANINLKHTKVIYMLHGLDSASV